MKKLILLMMVLFVGGLAGCSDKDDGMLKISSDPGDAEIYIDGDRKGNTPAEKGQTYAIKLSEGEHKIEIIKPIESPGKYDQYHATKKVFLAEKTLQTVSFELEKRQTKHHKEKWDEEQRLKAKAKAEEQRQKEIARAEENRRKAKAQEEAIAKAIQSIQENMVTIPSGRFQMGSDDGGSDEKPVHTVHIHSFKMGKYEVTQAQWQAVMGSQPSRFKGVNNPVEQVSWDEIQVFLGKLNKQSDKRFRLPSESEWEYAARAGSTTKYSWGDAVGKNRANCSGCGSQWDRLTIPVGSFQANGFGLYDMHGNVWEWVQDAYHDNYNGAPNDGRAWEGSGKRVLRGGSWGDSPGALCSAYRHKDSAGYRIHYRGFRLVQD